MQAGVRNTYHQLEAALDAYGIDTVLTAVQELLQLYSAESVTRATHSIPIYDAIERFKKCDPDQPPADI